MKWTKSEILNQGGNITFDEDIEINPEVFSGNVRINGVSEEIGRASCRERV